MSIFHPGIPGMLPIISSACSFFNDLNVGFVSFRFNFKFHSYPLNDRLNPVVPVYKNVQINSENVNVLLNRV